jgi:isopenicillin N synthase-like dioxygenase
MYHTDRKAFVEELRHACHKVGFFLVKHNFVPGVTERMLEETRQFFRRPLDEKLQISYEQSSSFRGYMQMGVENTSGKLDYREQIEYAVEYPTAVDTTQQQSWPVYERLKTRSNPWPNQYQSTLQPTTLEFSKHVCGVADAIRDSLCLALQLSPKVLANQFEHATEVPHWAVKLISYPPEDDAEQGVGAHTDTNFLTLVLQDQVGGLQAFSQGEWIDVPTEDSTNLLVCNLGEQAEIWSRGYFLATPHRVLRNTATRNRISVPLFYNPVLSAKIQPLEESLMSHVEWERPNNYENWCRENNAMLSSVGDNTFKSLARSHPEVFQKHHPDLILNEDGSITRKDNSS